mgnify:CR=1 FL=1
MSILVNGRVFDGESVHDDANLRIANGRVVELFSGSVDDGEQVLDLEGHLLAPGLIDLQVNGGGGVLFNDALPEGLPFVNGLLKKKGLQNLVAYSFMHMGHEPTVLLLDDLKEIGRPTRRQDILGHVTGRTKFYDDHLFDVAAARQIEHRIQQDVFQDRPQPARAGLAFDRAAARGQRLDIPAGTAVRFEPGQSREVQLIPYGGARMVYGFNQAVMGAL